MGFAAAAGHKWRVNRRMNVWGELGFVSLSVLAKQSDLTYFTEDGQRYSLNAVSGNKTVTYSKNAIVDSVGAQQPTYSLPFSNAGLQIGLSFDLGQNVRGSKGKNDIKDRRKKF